MNAKVVLGVSKNDDYHSTVKIFNDTSIEGLIDASLSKGVKRIAGTFFYGKSEIYLENSKSIEGNYKSTGLNFRIRAFGDDMYASGEALSCSTHLNHNFNPIKAGEEAGMICNQSVGWKKGSQPTQH